eukprot:216584-Amorphochlora_amoeboformis.AAC.2
MVLVPHPQTGREMPHSTTSRLLTQIVLNLTPSPNPNPNPTSNLTPTTCSGFFAISRHLGCLSLGCHDHSPEEEFSISDGARIVEWEEKWTSKDENWA